MAITSVGYGGTVNEAGWANISSQAGARYSVKTAGAFRVTALASPDRTVSIAAGDAYGFGVYDSNSASIQKQGATVSSGSRWDTVVIRRNWSGAGGTTTVELIQGTSTKAISASRETTPGTIDDQPIALVRFQAGSPTPAEVVDLRCWSGDGGLVAYDQTALAYLDVPGTRVTISDTTWVRTITAAYGSAWLKVDEPVTQTTSMGLPPTGWSASSGSGASTATTKGPHTTIHLEIRRSSGGTLGVGASGGIADTLIFTLTDALKPATRIAASAIYTSDDGSYAAGVYIETNGQVKLASGAPNKSIPVQPEGTTSVFVDATYLRAS